MTEETKTTQSPLWGTNTKLVAALTIVVIIGALLVKFQFILTPLLIALMLAYLLQPVVDFLQRRARFSWNSSVAVIYAVSIILLLGLLTLGGVELVQQVQSLIAIVQNAVTNLPQFIESLAGQTYQVGPFQFDFSSLDLRAISSQILNMVQPLLSQTGTLVGSLAGGAANFLGWTFFVILVSYFVLAESGGLRSNFINVDVPRYNYDIERLFRELGRTWNAFLRGQIIIFFIAIGVYAVVLGVLGVRYAVSLAFLAGLARFVPYVGPAINWAVLFLVTFFQVFKLFGMSPLNYSLLVLVIALIIDQVFDNIVSPRILSDALKVHPAGVLVAAIVAANLFGFIGVVLAAPLLATTALLWRYVMRKMLDMNPWPEDETRLPPPPVGSRLMVAVRRILRRVGLMRP